MDAKPEEGSRSEELPPTPASADEADGAPLESFGPLEMRRLRKDDGRALLVYARRPERP